MRTATATACANLAFVKYWGKRNQALNYPSTDSVGVNLAALTTRTTVAPLASADTDSVVINGVEQSGDAAKRVTKFLDIVRKRTGSDTRFAVTSENNFPTAAGLASSSSGFAALAVAAAGAAGLDFYTATELSALARRGSGSAARAVPAGFTYMHARRDDPSADSIAAPDALPLKYAIGVAGNVAKDMTSRLGMEHCAATSTYHSNWLARTQRDARLATEDIRAGDIAALGELAEANALAMHADGFAAEPPVVYFAGVTLEAFHLARRLRRDGVAAWFTCDAGPHPVLIFETKFESQVTAALKELRGIERVIVSVAGGAAQLET